MRGELSDDDNVKLVDPQLYHVTLAFIGNLSEDRVDAAADAVTTGSAGVPAHSGRASGLGAFPNPEHASVIWVGVEDTQLDELAQGVRTKLRERSIDFDDRHDFHPHLTVARLRDKEDRTPLIGPHEATDFGEFPVDRVHLYASNLTPEGPEYEVRATAKLG